MARSSVMTLGMNLSIISRAALTLSADPTTRRSFSSSSNCSMIALTVSESSMTRTLNTIYPLCGHGLGQRAFGGKVEDARASGRPPRQVVRDCHDERRPDRSRPEDVDLSI